MTALRAIYIAYAPDRLIKPLAAAIGHIIGMSKAERARWYAVARAVPLSQRHAGHILGKLQKAKPEEAA